MHNPWLDLTPTRFRLPWQMSYAEKHALISLLAEWRPTCSIEIGSATGGSLQVVSAYSEKVYSLDFDTTVPERLGEFKNVEFRIGDAKDTLPNLLDELHEAKTPIQFALLDGEHTAHGIRHNIESFFRHRPLVPLHLLMHDACNPEVRGGILAAYWSSNPHVHFVEMDFIQGWMLPTGPLAGQYWGGLAIATLLPEPRTTELVIHESQQAVFEKLTAPPPVSPLKRALAKLPGRRSSKD